MCVQTFLEADIQALKEAVQLTRHEAVQALKHTHGDVSKAFTNELAALDLDVSLVDGLVQTYALQRWAFWHPFCFLICGPQFLWSLHLTCDIRPKQVCDRDGCGNIFSRPPHAMSRSIEAVHVLQGARAD